MSGHYRKHLLMPVAYGPLLISVKSIDKCVGSEKELGWAERGVGGWNET